MLKKIALIALAAIGILAGTWYGSDFLARKPHVAKIKAQLQAQAHNTADTGKRLTEIKKKLPDHWTDGRVGITADGYVFYYDQHNSHGMDNIPDTNVLYLADENRFIVNGEHYCVDLGKAIQPKNKAELLAMF